MRAIAEALDGPEYLFISFDIDSLDPAYAPGTGTPEPGGLTSRELLHTLRRISRELNVIGADVVLGPDCVVGTSVLIEGRTHIGRNNRFFHGAADLSSRRFDVK